MEGKEVYNLKEINYGVFVRYKHYNKPISAPLNRGYTGKRGQAKNPDKSIRQSVSRAKDKIRGYIMANDWQYWATQTFNGEVIDRYSLDDIIRRYGKRLRNLKARHYDDLQWLIVPEQHKDGAWHLHMFMAGIPQDRVVWSGRDYYNKKNQFVRRIYNWLDTIDYGFNDYMYIGDLDPLERYKMANYVTKYITKDLAQVRFNKRMYWASRGLKSPTVTNTYVYDVNRVMSDKFIISDNTYYIKDNETGEIYNVVRDFMTFDF